MKPPQLLARSRAPHGMALVILAICQAAVAIGFASAITNLMNDVAGQQIIQLASAVTLAILAGIATLLERWTAEKFAQSFISDCRTALFESMIRNRGDGSQERWITSIGSDLNVLRTYAIRGPILLWTNLLAGTAASIWFVFMVQSSRLMLVPLLLGFLLIGVLSIFLPRAISKQRKWRGQLNRFIVRRVLIESTASPSPRGHGNKKLTELSLGLSKAAQARATIFGSMEACAVIAGGCAMLVLAISQKDNGAEIAEAVGELSLIAFIAAKLLEATRALNAEKGGKLALIRLSNLLQEVVENKTNNSKDDEE